MKILIYALGFLFVNTFFSDYGVPGVDGMFVPSISLAAGTLGTTTAFNTIFSTWKEELQKKAKCEIVETKVECCITHKGDDLIIHRLCCALVLHEYNYDYEISIDNVVKDITFKYGTSNEYCIKFLNFNNTQLCTKKKRLNPESDNFRLELLLRIDTSGEKLILVRFREISIGKDNQLEYVDSIYAPTDVEFISTNNVVCNAVKKGVKMLSGSTDPGGYVTEYLEAIRLFCGWMDFQSSLTSTLSSASGKLVTAGYRGVTLVCDVLGYAINNVNQTELSKEVKKDQSDHFNLFSDYNQ